MLWERHVAGALGIACACVDGLERCHFAFGGPLVAELITLLISFS